MFDSIGTFISTHRTIISIVGALLLAAVALYGYKLYKAWITVIGAVVGITFGAALGNILLPIIGGIIGAILLGALFGFLAFRFYLFLQKALAFIIICVLSALYGMIMPWIIESRFLEFILIVIAILITVAIVRLIFFVLFKGTILFGTAFGGAIGALLLISSIIPVPFISIIAIVLGIVAGFFCLIYQIKSNFNTSLKDMNWKSLAQEKKKKVLDNKNPKATAESDSNEAENNNVEDTEEAENTENAE